MRIILTYPDDLAEETEDAIIDWLRDKMIDSLMPSPLKYCEKMEAEK